MAFTHAKWHGWLVALIFLAAIGAGLWYAQAHGHLAPAEARVRHLVSKDRAGNSELGGMDSNMPGMSMGTMRSAQTASSVAGHAEVNLPYEVQQRIGVTVGRVEEAPLRMSVRTVGIVQANETRVNRVHLKTEGWVQKLFVDYTGQQVRKGDPLLSIYSPQFLTTQQELLSARQAAASGGEPLARLTRERLELWDVPTAEIEELERTGKPRTFLTLRSPITGTVLSKNVFQGQYLTPQTELYQVADLSTVWVQAKVYEYELPHVELGQPATVTVAALPGREFEGKVVFVQPTVQEPARTVEVRIELANPNGEFKPGMFTTVVIQHTMGKGLLVPASAVIRTGVRDVAYRVLSAGRFIPVQVTISPFRYENRYHVLHGLHAGEEVVTSADFLIDSESRLRVGGMGGMAGMPGMDRGGMKGKEHKGGMKMDHEKGTEGLDHDKIKP
jgi:Cu(I)/Ag(I) efflux system membrane fusion protein